MIPFTQYLPPDGRTKLITIDRPEEVEMMARAVIAHGWAFEAEVLSTGEVSLTVADNEEGIDVCIELVQNGPGLPEAVDQLVHNAYEFMKGGTDVQD